VSAPGTFVSRLRRELGTLHSYAALIGILVGAGIFRVARDAYAETGPSVLLGYVALTPVVLATAVAYVVYGSTPLGRAPGGEYAHIARTWNAPAVAFLGAWLKLIAYLGALAFLATVLADYALELLALLGAPASPELRMPLALASLVFFFGVHALGVRWFGRVQIALCAVLGVAIVVLVGPGLLAIEPVHYRPFFTAGLGGFLASLPPLFFAFAGFEALAQTAGEVRDSTRRLPRVYVRGILATAAIFVAMSAVAFGVLPRAQMLDSNAPMAQAAALYLPGAGAALVAIGGIAAVATSLNASLLVPARLALVLAEDGLLPAVFGRVHAATGAPLLGLSATLAIGAALVLSGQIALTLNIAVFALMAVYAVHSAALLALPRANRELYAAVTVAVPRPVQCAAALVSLLALAALLAVLAVADARWLADSTLGERFVAGRLTSLELAAVWSAVGFAVFALRRRQALRISSGSTDTCPSAGTARRRRPPARR
jgi:amino acid transporter